MNRIARLRDRLRRGTLAGAAMFIIAAAAVIAYLAPLFEEPFAWGSTRDWGYFTFLEEVTRKTLLEFAQFPLWNPYYFGGAEHFANPQTTILSPTTLLTIGLGTALGLKVGIVAFAILGVTGMYRLTRHFGGDRSGALVAGLLYGCSGWFAQHVGGGHWGFAATALYPWTAVAFLWGIHSPRHLVFASAGAVWVTMHWGVYTVPWLFEILLVLAVGEAIARRTFAPLRAYAFVAVTTAGLAAVRLLPVLEYVGRFPRRVAGSDHLGLDDLVRILLVDQNERDFPGHPWEWPEYGNYIGLFALGLILASLWIRVPRRPLLLCGVAAFLALATGDWGPASPYAWLHRLPVLEYLRVPSRYTLAALFFAAPLAGLVCSELIARLARRRHGAALAAVAGLAAIAAVAVDPIRVNRRQFEQSFHLPQPTDSVSSAFVQKRGDPFRMYAYPRANQGSALGLEESPIPLSLALRIDAERQVLLATADGNRLEEVSWSPNEIDFYVETAGENLLVINQNYRREWHEEGGREIVDHRGLLAVRLLPGRHVVHLRYRSVAFGIGLAISLATVGLLACASYVAHRRRRAARDATAPGELLQGTSMPEAPTVRGSG